MSGSFIHSHGFYYLATTDKRSMMCATALQNLLQTKCSYVSVPRDENRRKAWFNAMRRKNVLSSKTLFAAVCADHFDLENDIENYYCYHDYQNLDIECSIHSKIVCNSESYRKIYVGDY
ncbi:hypothetical protein M8J77_018305 [Diaphorina citri]|nr:hypothetical protein M8J77_018305 [Diaphorina citri]